VTAPLTRTEFDRVDELLRRASNMRPALRHPLINMAAHFRRMADALALIARQPHDELCETRMKEFEGECSCNVAIARDALPPDWEKK
jgi:hypothetical protein